MKEGVGGVCLSGAGNKGNGVIKSKKSWCGRGMDARGGAVKPRDTTKK